MKNLEKEFVIFWIDTQREIYGDEQYYVLGELMGTYDTEEEAELAILEMQSPGRIRQMITILPIYKKH